MLYLRRVHGNSMFPALRHGKFLLLCRTTRLHAGDVVMLSHDGLEKIKRIKELTAESVYVVGDNAAASTDSRAFGWLPRSSVTAKLVWPHRP